MTARSTVRNVAVVVLAYAAEPHLDACLAAIRASRGVDVELLVVDNGCTRGDLTELLTLHGARLLRPATNLGFAGGCNAGVSALLTHDVVALVNSDAVLHPDALQALADALTDEVAVASACVRLAHAPHLVNSAGNPVHFTGVSWAGGMGESAAAHVTPREVASASGAAMAIRRSAWDELGGFDAAYFTYLEDTELSLRCWLGGWKVVYVPEAVALHHYDFSRNKRKHYYLERNRLLLLLTVYERRTLLLLGPALLLWEMCVIAGALVQGWLPSKLRGWLWLLRNQAHVQQRRRLIQRTRRRGDAELAPLLETRITGASIPLPRGFGVVDAALAAYWRAVRRRLVATR